MNGNNGTAAIKCLFPTIENTEETRKKNYGVHTKKKWEEKEEEIKVE